MSIELGRIGAMLTGGGQGGLGESAAELESLGFSAVWIAGGQLDNLGRIGEVIRATNRVPVATAIIPVDVYDSASVARAYAEYGGDRFLVGVGGAHGPRPLSTIAEFLDRLDGVPTQARVLSALGPRMLELAGQRTAGSCPLLVTPEYTEQARALLGAGKLLAPMQCVVLDEEPERARGAAREIVGFLTNVPGYRALFARMGFTEQDVVRQSDRLVDGVVAWGSVDAIAARVSDHLAAGADHVALNLLSSTSDGLMPRWRDLADALC